MERKNKKEIRTEVKRRRAGSAMEKLHVDSVTIVEKFTALDVYQNTPILLAYVDAKREVETRLLMEQAWKDGKKVASPRCDDDGIMHY